MEYFSPYGRLEEHARRQPHEAAIIRDHSRLTYDALLERVTSCAGWLLGEGLAPGEVTGLCIRDEIEHLVCAMALICMGTPQMSLGAHELGTTKRSLAQKVGIGQLVADQADDWMDSLKVIPFGNSYGAARTRNPRPDNLVFDKFGLDSVALYRNTSGSTDVPKTFEVSLRRLLSAASSSANDPRERRTLRTGSIEFDAHRFQRIASLVAGNTCVFVSDVNLPDIVSVCESAEISMIQMGAPRLASLLRAQMGGYRRLPSFTNISMGGSRVPGPLRSRIKEALTDNLWIQYATSEVGTISVASPDQHDRFPEGIGFPIEGIHVEIVGQDGNLLAPGEIGQIRVRKHAMASGYVSEAGAISSFRDGWFYPRDLVSRAPGEPMIFHGRADDVMILNGINIFPAAIEDTLEGHADVQEAVAFAVESRIHGQIPVAAVVLSANAEGRDVLHLMNHCRERLGMRGPRQILAVKSIPRSAVGKPLRRQLAEMYFSS